jgi:hypothetical protein
MGKAGTSFWAQAFASAHAKNHAKVENWNQIPAMKALLKKELRMNEPSIHESGFKLLFLVKVMIRIN